jgi:signal transduction histidine kinase
MDNFQPVRPGLWRKASLTLAAFTLLTTVSTAVIAGFAESRHERQRFLDLAQANAAFVDSSGLPPGMPLARKLSGVLGIAIGFRLPSGEVVTGDGPPEIWASLLDGLPAQGQDVRADQGWELRTLPLRTGAGMLFLRPAPTWRSAWGPGMIAALWMFPVLALLPALILARDIVSPLRRLGAWLPQLRLDEDAPASADLPAELLSRTDELGDLARALSEARHRLTQEVERRRQSERLATFGRMATSLAHEIKNPAAAISLHASILADPTTAESDRSASIAAIQSSASGIASLVHQWLFVVRPSPPRRSRHDLRSIVDAARAALATLADHHGITFVEMFRPPSPVSIVVDGTRIEHAVRNLLVNACQAMPMGGEVEIHWETIVDGPIRLRVRDHGTGLSSEALRRFGEPFFSTKEGGLGLGLNLVTEVMRAHGGSVEIVNRSPGAEVTISFQPATDGSQLPS